MNEQERELLRRKVLGSGLACAEIMPGQDIGRDLVMQSGPDGVGLSMVAGMDNLVQDLSIALTTALGSDIFNTGFGFDGLNAMMDGTSALLTRERIRISIIQVLRLDPRVRQVIDVKLDDGQLDQPLAGSRELNVRVVFEAISGDQVAIDVGKGLINA